MPILTPEEYRKQAQSMYDPSYAVKVAQANAGFNNAMAGYENQANQINTNFQKGVDSTNRNTALNQNQFNNNTLSRGMARSSIATTGLAGIKNTGNRVIGELEVQKNQDLNNLENLKNTLRANLDATLSGLSAEREAGINGLASQLMQRDQDLQYRTEKDTEEKNRYNQEWAFKTQQAESNAKLDAEKRAEEQRRYEQEWAFKQQQAKADEAYRQAQLRKSSSSSSGSSGSTLTSKQITDFKNQIEAEMLNASVNPTERARWINSYESQILTATGNDTNFLDALKKKANEGATYNYGTRGYSLSGK